MKKLLLALLAALWLAGCGVGNPWPVVPPAVPGHEVLLIGDSLMGNTAPTVSALMPETVFHDEHRNGSGLVDPIDGMTPTQFFESRLAMYPKVDTVLFEWAGACATPCKYAYGTPQFGAAWNAEQHSLLDSAAAHGVKAVWVISPPVPPEGTPGPPYTIDSATAVNLNALDRQLPVPKVDWFTALADVNGQYEQWLQYSWFSDPVWHQVRADDLIHLTADGAFRTAMWTVNGLRGAWNGNQR